MASLTRNALALAAPLVIAACATPDFNYTPQSTEISEPLLGERVTVYVGDVMLRQGKYTEHDAIYVKNKIDTGIAYDILPGYYLKKGEDKTTETFLPSGGDESGHVKVNPFSSPFAAVIVNKNGKRICVVSTANSTVCSSNTDFERKKRPVLSNNSFQQTLIYSGKVSDKINVGYREFSSNIARPAFNNDVEYDLSQSSTVGYKGAKIEIIEATNESITYRVINSFNQAKF